MINWNELPKPRGDVTKLPKWAQDYVEILARRVVDAEKYNDKVAGVATQEPGTVSFTDHLRLPRPIPTHDKIFFHFEMSRGVMREYITARYYPDQWETDGVEISSGSSPLRIESRATNLIIVRLKQS